MFFGKIHKKNLLENSLLVKVLTDVCFSLIPQLRIEIYCRTDALMASTIRYCFLSFREFKDPVGAAQR